MKQVSVEYFSVQASHFQLCMEKEPPTEGA